MSRRRLLGQRSTPLDLTRWQPSISAYADWINGLDPAAAKNWAHRLGAADLASAEGAVAEAVGWNFLVHRVDEIRPGSLSCGGPDFRCTKGGQVFFVEVTNLSSSSVTAWTGLSEELEGPQHYKDLTGLIKREVSGKASQGRNIEAPYLVLVTTLHSMASHVCIDRAHVAHVLHSTTAISGDFVDGEVVGPLREITRMELSAFTNKFTVDPARRNVSAVLAGGFGTYPDVRVLGVTHPDPVHAFEPSLLQDVPFLEFAVWPPDPRIITRWTVPEQTPKNRAAMRAWMQHFKA